MTDRKPKKWTTVEVGDQSGRVALITGANTGIGLGAARVLAQHGASVVMACRNMTTAEAAAATIRASGASGPVEIIELDLGSQAAVKASAARFLESHPRLDLLINNAGVMLPKRDVSGDGYEQQFGVNHLGHFALTGLLLDRLLATPGSRVVTVSSSVHRIAKMNFADLQSTKKYRGLGAYGQSKLANLLFTYELQRRLKAANTSTLATAAHPGWARTDLQCHAAKHWWWTAAKPIEGMFSQSADDGALPTLMAAVDPEARGGEYYGPSGFMEGKGSPKKVGSSKRSHDGAAQQRLWAISEELTGVKYVFPA